MLEFVHRTRNATAGRNGFVIAYLIWLGLLHVSDTYPNVSHMYTTIRMYLDVSVCIPSRSMVKIHQDTSRFKSIYMYICTCTWELGLRFRPSQGPSITFRVSMSDKFERSCLRMSVRASGVLARSRGCRLRQNFAAVCEGDRSHLRFLFPQMRRISVFTPDWFAPGAELLPLGGLGALCRVRP